MISKSGSTYTGGGMLADISAVVGERLRCM